MIGPNISIKLLKRKFNFFIIILLIFTTFLSTISVLFDLTSTSEDIYGTDDNIMIFYDTQANTPFTSQVSSIYENGFQSITGIINISPEIFQSVLINDKPAFLRGANYSKISELDEINILEGNELDMNDPYGAIIGETLAERLNIGLSDVIEIRSIINDQIIKFNIVGIYGSSTITDDEVIVNNNIARLLGNIYENHFNHYRIKYDPTVISSDEIQKLVTQKYVFEPNIIVNNDTLVDNLNVVIKEKNGVILFDEKFENLNLPFDLLRGDYSIQFYQNTELITNNDFQIPLMSTLRVELGNDIFYTKFNVTYKEMPIENVNAILYNINSGDEIVVQINDGYFDLNLSLGSYNLTIFDDLSNNSVIFDVTRSENFDFDFSYFPIKFSKSLNNTTYAQNNILLHFDAFDKDYKIEVGNTTINKNEINSMGEYMLYLEDGDYAIEVKSASGRLFELYQLRVNSSKDYILPYVENREYIKFKENGYLDFEYFGLLKNEIYCNFDYIIDENIIQIAHSELNYGQNYIRIIMNTTLGEKLDFFYSYYLINNSIQWYSGIPIPIMKINDSIYGWFDDEIDFNETGYIFNLTNKNIFEMKVNNSKIGNDRLFENQLEIELVSNYSSLFSINGQKLHNYNINSVKNTILFPNYDFPFQTNNFWRVDIEYQGMKFRVLHNITIYLNNSLGPDNLVISITNMITNTLETINLSVNITENTNIKNKISGFQKQIINGIIDYDNIETEIRNANFTRNNEIFSPIFYLNKILLPVGNYTVKLNFSNQMYLWNFTIFGIAKNTNINYLSVTDRYYNGDAQVVTGLFFDDGNNAISANFNNYVDYFISRSLDGNVTVVFTNLRLGNITVSVDDEMIMNQNIISNIIELPFLNNTYQIAIENLHLDNVIRNYEFMIDASIIYQNYTIFVNDINKNFDDIIYFEIIDLNIEKLAFETSNNAMLNITLTSNDIEIKFKTIDGVIYYRLDLTLDPNTPTNITIGVVRVNISLYNDNFENIQKYVNYIIVTEKANNDTIRFKNQFDYILPIGNYEFNFYTDFGGYNYEFELLQDKEIKVELNTTEQIVLFDINNIDIPNRGILRIYSLIGNEINTINLDYNTERYNLTLESGEYNYIIDEDWGGKSGRFVVLFDTEVSIIIVLSTIDKINIDIENFVKLQNVGFNVSSDYLDEYLGGLLILIFVIIFAEIFVLTLISFYIFTEVIRFIIIQSKKEIMIMKSIGAGIPQISKIFLKEISGITILAGIISLAGSHLILETLFSFNATVFFGHKFSPTLIDLHYLVLFYVLMISTMIFSTRHALKQELFSNE